jgi:hypothetical protein
MVSNYTALLIPTEGTTQLGPEQGDRWSKTLNWCVTPKGGSDNRYFFVVTNYFLYGESIIYYFKHIVFVDAYFIPFARNHRFISFMLYVVGMSSWWPRLRKALWALWQTCSVNILDSNLRYSAGYTLVYYSLWSQGLSQFWHS